MIVSLIAALADNGVIGIANTLPWKLPADMRWFREKTLGKPVIMGRKTFDSLGGKPLPGRTNIVITADADYQAPGALVVASIDAALRAAGDCAEAMIIGGASLYAQTLPRADRLYLTFVHIECAGDAYFPEFDRGQWRQSERHDFAADERNAHAYSFTVWERANKF